MANCGEDIIPAVAQDVETGEVLIVLRTTDTAQKEMATFGVPHVNLDQRKTSGFS